MPKFPIGTRVTLKASAHSQLRGLPPSGVELRLAPHRRSVSPTSLNKHTQLVGVIDGAVTWLGALGEDLLVAGDEQLLATAPALLSATLLRGKALWRIVRPGSRYKPGAGAQVSTAYAGDRPWLVIGQLATGDLVAVPLNEANSPQSFTPIISSKHLALMGGKDSLVEVAHVWSLPKNTKRVGDLHPDGRVILEAALRSYFCSAGAETCALSSAIDERD